LWADRPATRRVAGLLGTLLLFATAALLTGCQAPAQPTGPAEIVLQLHDYDAFVDASLSLLHRYDIPPDRVDRTRGLIISRPTTSAQWFEWWRVDVPGGYQLLESSIATMQRTVTIHIDPLGVTSAPAAETQATQPRLLPADGITNAAEEKATPISGRFRVRVQVDKTRLSAPERQITTASGAMSMYSVRTPTVEGQRGKGSRGVEWVPHGRDALLEAFFIDQLSHALPDVEVVEQPPEEAGPAAP
jgi:hypothetical protein